MHVSSFLTYDALESFSNIDANVQEAIRNSGDGYGSEEVIFCTEKVLGSYEEACKYLEEKERLARKAGQSYPSFAVKFKNFILVDTNKSRDYRKKSREARKDLNDFKEESLLNLKAHHFITCKRCGSKTNTEYQGDASEICCPCCGVDLRTATAKKKMSALKKKEQDYLKKAYASQKKTNINTEWLVIYSYHD